MAEGTLTDYCPAMILACAKHGSGSSKRWVASMSEVHGALKQRFYALDITQAEIDGGLNVLSEAGVCTVDRSGQSYVYRLDGDIQGLVERAYWERDKWSRAGAVEDLTALYSRMRSFRLISDFSAIERYYYYGDEWLSRRVSSLVQSNEIMAPTACNKDAEPPVTPLHINDVVAERILSELQNIEMRIVSLDLSNSDKATAHSYVLAIRALASSPEPDVGLIWLIVERAAAIAGIASLFVTLVALLK